MWPLCPLPSLFFLSSRHFSSHFQCIQHLTGPDSQQCGVVFKGLIKSLFPLSIYKKEFIIKAHLSIQSSPPHSIFFPHGRLLLAIFFSSSPSPQLTLLPTFPLQGTGQSLFCAVNAIFFRIIMDLFIPSKFIFKILFFLQSINISSLYSVISSCVIFSTTLSRMDELDCSL